MWYLICIVGGAVAGAIGAVIYYRSHVVEVEVALAKAVSARAAAEETARALKDKVGKL